MKISDIINNLRPRERLIYEGVESLNDYELLALIIGNGSKEDNVLDLSKKILSNIGLKKLSTIRVNDLTKINGIGNAKATRIIASFEIARRAWKNKDSMPILNTAEKIAGIYTKKYSGTKQEKLILLCLDSRMRLMKEEVIFIGLVDSLVAHPREIFNIAIKENSSYIIILHNHPSGNPRPSDHDIVFTKQIQDAGKIIGINILDHIIITDNSHYSFKTEGRM